jgi:lipoate-protein ligase A
VTSRELVVLIDEPAAGPVNMARDEALLEAVGSGEQPPTLRFYGWEPATVSLGYFQEIAEFRAQPEPIRGLAVVRRTTGGGAILHDQEVTYALAVPIGHAWLRPNANRLYELAHRAIIAAVGSPARLLGRSGRPGGCADESAPVGRNSSRRSLLATHRAGPFFCFARRHEYDVVVPDPRDATGLAKLAGSAQRRTRQAVLQHGSLILASRFAEQRCATWSALGGPSGFDSAVARLLRSFEAALGVRAAQSEWPAATMRRSDALVQKYGGELWTLGCGPNRRGCS